MPGVHLPHPLARSLAPSCHETIPVYPLTPPVPVRARAQAKLKRPQKERPTQIKPEDVECWFYHILTDIEPRKNNIYVASHHDPIIQPSMVSTYNKFDRSLLDEPIYCPRKNAGAKQQWVDLKNHLVDKFNRGDIPEDWLSITGKWGTTIFPTLSHVKTLRVQVFSERRLRAASAPLPARLCLTRAPLPHVSEDAAVQASYAEEFERAKMMKEQLEAQAERTQAEKDKEELVNGIDKFFDNDTAMADALDEESDDPLDESEPESSVGIDVDEPVSSDEDVLITDLKKIRKSPVAEPDTEEEEDEEKDVSDRLEDKVDDEAVKLLNELSKNPRVFVKARDSGADEYIQKVGESEPSLPHRAKEEQTTAPKKKVMEEPVPPTPGDKGATGGTNEYIDDSSPEGSVLGPSPEGSPEFVPEKEEDDDDDEELSDEVESSDDDEARRKGKTSTRPSGARKNIIPKHLSGEPITARNHAQLVGVHIIVSAALSLKKMHGTVTYT